MVKNSHNYPNSLIEKLRLNWFDLFQKSTLDFYLGNRTFITLIEGYSNKQRTYHNIYHIYSILILLEQVKDYSKDIDILKFSAWFHDYVYDPKVTDNETKSAIYAAKTLKDLNINVQTIKAVTQIVLSTKTHKPLLKGIDNLIFLDADLAILGTTRNKYYKYAQAIRQEYNHLSDRNYQQGRKKVLTQLINRERIYYTDYFYQRLESKARDNLQAEINYLALVNA